MIVNLQRVIGQHPQQVVNQASVSLVNSSISASLHPPQLMLSTVNRLNIDAPLPVVSQPSNLTIEFNGGLVASGTQPLINIPAHSSVEFALGGLNVHFTDATLQLIKAFITTANFSVQVISNPTVVILV